MNRIMAPSHFFTALTSTQRMGSHITAVVGTPLKQISHLKLRSMEIESRFWAATPLDRTRVAQEGSPGSNPCDTELLRKSIQELRNEGYNPIVTFQHMEVCQAEPVGPQRGDFQRAADAGAVIVSGSQGHCPQVMEFYRDVVIHYGLGNLFFDQMDKIERMAFVDRYWFYDNRLIGVEPIPIIRDDAAQPRQMTVEEARWFLKEISALAGGNQMKNLCIGLLLITIAAGCSVPTIFQPTPTPTLTPAPTL